MPAGPTRLQISYRVEEIVEMVKMTNGRSRGTQWRKFSAMEFRSPDFSRPVDVDAELARFAEGDTIKGVILGNVSDQLKAAGHDAPKFTAFRDYPFHDYIRLLIEASQLLFPDEPVREGLRRIGHGHYAAFVDTTIGRVIFGVLGRNMAAVLKASPKGYRYSTNCARCSVVGVDKTEQRAVLRLAGVPLIDCLQVGVYEGGVRATGHDGEVRVADDDEDDGLLLEVTWR